MINLFPANKIEGHPSLWQEPAGEGLKQSGREIPALCHRTFSVWLIHGARTGFCTGLHSGGFYRCVELP